LAEPLLAVLKDEALAFHVFMKVMDFAAVRFDQQSEDGIQVGRCGRRGSWALFLVCGKRFGWQSPVFLISFY
jgi:hypothetical protein